MHVMRDEDRARLSKLPQWAQRLIEIQEMRLGERDKTIANLRDLRGEGDTTTNVRIEDRIGSDMLLPRDSSVTFDLKDQAYENRDVKLIVKHAERWRQGKKGSQYTLELYATDGHLQIIPSSSNVAYVEVTRGG